MKKLFIALLLFFFSMHNVAHAHSIGRAIFDYGLAGVMTGLALVSGYAAVVVF